MLLLAVGFLFPEYYFALHLFAGLNHGLFSTVKRSSDVLTEILLIVLNLIADNSINFVALGFMSPYSGAPDYIFRGQCHIIYQSDTF